MFRKLRLRLTLINASIIIALFLLLIVGVYFFSQIELNRRSDIMAERIIDDLKSGRITDLPPRTRQPEPERGQHRGGPPEPVPGPPPGSLAPPPGASFFFVKTASSGAITAQSSALPLASDRLATLTEVVLKSGQQKGMADFDQTSYSYRKAALDDQGMIVLFHDLTHELQLRRALLTALVVVGVLCSLLSFGASFYMASRAMVPIQNAWRQQKNFLSDASHELRSPLAIIQTNLDIVLMKPEETVASQRKWLKNIQEEAVLMAKLVDSLLFLARADSHQQMSMKELFSLSAAVERAAAPLRVIAAAKEVMLDVDAEAMVDFYGDEEQLKRVTGILLDNAIRHTPSGGRVLASLARSEPSVILTVADTGEGIAPEHLDKIFDRFFQVDESRAKGGAGLGLAIARWIVENHGGNIGVKSSPGNGTIFTVSLPLEIEQV